MRRRVVISNKKSKAIAVLVAVALSLTSIHLAATARIATLKRQQEQLEKTTLSNQPSTLSQDSPLQSGVASANQFGNTTTPQQAANTASSEKTALSAKPATPVSGSNADPARRRQIVISIADRQLAVMDSGRVIKIYPIAVGKRGTPSPDGDFVIINRAKDPTYRHGETEIAPGKDNPLGSRWMGLNLKGYGIHGTNVQSSIGKAISHGCFRMRKQDVEELYSLMQVGDTVTVRRERDAMIAQVFAAPGVPATALAAKTTANAEMQVASASVTSVETTEQ
jgi:lipoprotein-anchoring transpeptidase ErfK/SrfK